MKNLLLLVLLVLISSTIGAVPANQTDLPFAYGEQLKNSTFESNWETTNNEPADKSWHSFNTGDMSTLSSAAKNINQFNFSSTQLRPETTGAKSARMSYDVIMSQPANGNITTGRIKVNITAGDMLDLAKAKNNLTKCYNYTNSTDPNYRTSFTMKPDSITVWANFKTTSTTQLARISTVLHGDVSMQDPPSTTALRNQVAGICELEFTNTSGWKRLSIPFQYNSYVSFTDFTDLRKTNNRSTYTCANIAPKYILLTATTCNVPGGTAGDTLWIDDILMIYNPTLSIGTLSGSSYAKGGSITVPYTLEGTMSPYNSLTAKNKVILQLSDANGSFENPTVLNEVETDFGGEISGTIPDTVTDGTGYRVRIVTTNYPMISSDNGSDISISTPTDIQTISTPSVTLSPTPAQGVIEISNFEITQAEIFNLQGQSVSTVSIVGNNRIDVSTLPVGSYILQLKGRDGQMVRTKLLINR